MLSENIWLTWYKPLDYWIFEEKKCWGTDKQTERHTEQKGSREKKILYIDLTEVRFILSISFCNRRLQNYALLKSLLKKMPPKFSKRRAVEVIGFWAKTKNAQCPARLPLIREDVISVFISPTKRTTYCWASFQNFDTKHQGSHTAKRLHLRIENVIHNGPFFSHHLRR